MNKELVYNDLLKIVNEEDIKIDEPMKKHISFRVGGPADILVRPRTEEQLSQILNEIINTKWSATDELKKGFELVDLIKKFKD